MSTKILDERLQKALDDYTNEIRLFYEDETSKPATRNDINEAAQQTAYLLGCFKNEIIDYLKHN